MRDNSGSLMPPCFNFCNSFPIRLASIFHTHINALGVVLFTSYGFVGLADGISELCGLREPTLRRYAMPTDALLQKCSPVNSRENNQKERKHEVGHIGKALQQRTTRSFQRRNQLLKALPKMAKGASAPELKDAFEK